MATIATNHGLIHAAVDFALRKLEQFADAMHKRRVYKQTLNELRNLTTRDLVDLGISPANIKCIAYEAAYGK